MTPNIIALAAQLITPDLVGRIAEGLGLDAPTARKAIDAAIPAILSAIVGHAAKPAGAEALATVLGGLDPGGLEPFSKPWAPETLQKAASEGSSTLSGWLGPATVGALSTAVARHAGIGIGQARTVIGLSAPLLLGLIGRQQKAVGLDAAGLGRFLADQRPHVEAALPEGLGDRLAEAGLLDGPGPIEPAKSSSPAPPAVISSAPAIPRGTTATVPRTGPTATAAGSGPAAEPATPSPTPDRSGMRSPARARRYDWWMWAIPLVIIAAIAWYLATGSRPG